jgi:hypothetical protein
MHFSVSTGFGFAMRNMPGRSEVEKYFVELLFSLRIHYSFFEDGTLLLDPTAQCWVKAAPVWHFTCNSGREEGGVLVGYSR